jgi:hypothetical protein
LASAIGVDVDCGAELDVELRIQVSIYREKIVLAVHRDAVSSIKEQGYVRALGLYREFAQTGGHPAAVEIDPLDHVEADVAQQCRHPLGVDRRVRQWGRMPVCTITDNEGHAALGAGRMSQKSDENDPRTNDDVQTRQDVTETAHDLPPRESATRILPVYNC